MLDSFVLSVFVGMALGFLAGLGVGGGSLLLLWLTLVLNMDREIATGINLLFFLPAALISCILRIKQGGLKLRPIVPAAIAGAGTAALFTALSSFIDAEMLRRPFGVLLLITGVSELIYRPRNAR